MNLRDLERDPTDSRLPHCNSTDATDGPGPVRARTLQISSPVSQKPLRVWDSAAAVTLPRRTERYRRASKNFHQWRLNSSAATL